MNHTSLRIGFLGAGNLTRSLIGGLMASGNLYPSQVFCHDRHPEKMAFLSERYQICHCQTPSELAEQADVIILAVKPKDLHLAINTIQSILKQRTCLLISTAIGISTEAIQTWLKSKNPIIRAMPNTPALLQSGATGLYANLQATDEHRNHAETLFRAVGTTVWLNHEHDIDTVALLSGSGPAYFLYLMKSLQQCGESLGLSSNTAKILTYQTALGAARLALENTENLSDLIQHIATPGGITEQALQELDSHKVHELIQTAFMSAQKKLKQISEQFKEN